MKRFCHALILAAFPALLFAQEKTAASSPSVALLLGRAKIESGLNQGLSDKVESQLASILTRGDATYGAKFSVFVLSPTLSVVETGKFEGLQTRQVVKLNLNLKVSNSVTGEVFGSTDLTMAGSGTSKDDATNRALSGIRSNSALLKDIEGFQSKIGDYYRDKCADVQASARAREAEQDFSGALLLLHSVPPGTACSAEIDAQKTALFKQVQDKNCESLLQRVDAQTAAKNYSMALAMLAQADVQSSCAGEVKKRIADLQTKVQEAEQTKYEWLFKFWAAGADAEKARWNALTAFCLDSMRNSGKGNLVPR